MADTKTKADATLAITRIAEELATSDMEGTAAELLDALHTLTQHAEAGAVAWPDVMVNIPHPDGSTDRVVGFRVPEGDPILGEYGLSEPLNWLRKVTVERFLHPAQPASQQGDAPVRGKPELCGCGKPAEYMTFDGGWCCNKYGIKHLPDSGKEGV